MKRTLSASRKQIFSITNILFRHQLVYIFALIVILVVVLGYLGYFVEHLQPGANIITAGDGIWWAVVSVTSVGYGDLYPITLLGRVIGGLLMTVGLSAFSLLTANIAALMVEQDEQTEFDRLGTKIEKLEGKLDKLLERIGD